MADRRRQPVYKVAREILTASDEKLAALAAIGELGGKARTSEWRAHYRKHYRRLLKKVEAGRRRALRIIEEARKDG